MATKNQIKEVLAGYEVNSGVDSEFGDWVVSNDADIVNVDKMYPIYTPQVQSGNIDSWLEHMREKTWFNCEEESNFQKAYKRAEELLKK